MEPQECQCPQSGYCEYFKQEMTYDPPNWQWCQNASKEERSRYKIDCDKKHERRKALYSGEYITNEQLIKDCKDLLLPKLGKLKLKGVLGVPRSGLFPASLISLWLNLPLYRVGKYGEAKILSASSDFGGVRMSNFASEDGKLLVIDDTMFSGTAMMDSIDRINEELFCAVVYAHPDSQDKVDFFAKILKPPHLLEWNLFNSHYMSQTLLDFDGVLSPNVPHEICIDEERYIEYIKNVEPFYHRIPRRRCKGIVTARLEKYRGITEDWLERHGVDYGFLKMYPTEKEQVRNKNHIEEAAKFKSEIFSRSDAVFFIESERAEANIIQQMSNKLVICPDGMG